LAMQNIATNYSGKKGKKYLLAQGYDEAMVEDTHGVGTEVLKFRGGMAPLGMTRIYGVNRFANSLALLDANIRKVAPEEAHGARCGTPRGAPSHRGASPRRSGCPS